MFEHPWTGKGTFLGDVTHHECGEPRGLGVGDELLSAAAHLGDRPGTRRNVGVGDGLDGVDDHEIGP